MNYFRISFQQKKALAIISAKPYLCQQVYEIELRGSTLFNFPIQIIVKYII